MPAISTQFGDLLDVRLTAIYNEQRDREQLSDFIPKLYGEGLNNGRADVRYSSVGAFSDLVPFTGTVEYDDLSQGYDVIGTPVEFASGFQIERKLYADDQFGIMDQRPAGLATAAMRTRQKHAARVFTNSTSIDTMFYNHTEGVPLCSNSHTTTSGASTAAGFDNLVTTALSATALAAARIQFRGFRDDRANRYNAMPDELWIPPDLYDVAFEIVNSAGKPDTAENNSNVHKGAYTVNEWNYMSDTNDWFLCDSGTRKQMLLWFDREALEFAYAEDLDTIIAKWRLYGRWAWLYRDWRFILGAQVS